SSLMCCKHTTHPGLAAWRSQGWLQCGVPQRLSLVLFTNHADGELGDPRPAAASRAQRPGPAAASRITQHPADGETDTIAAVTRRLKYGSSGSDAATARPREHGPCLATCVRG